MTTAILLKYAIAIYIGAWSSYNGKDYRTGAFWALIVPVIVMVSALEGMAK